MLDIQISDNTKITSDDKNYVVQKRRKLTNDLGTKKTGDWGQWRDESYYTDWDSLVEDMLHLKIRQSDAKTLKEVANAIKRFKMPKV